MPSGDSPDITLAHVDPVILSCWERLVKQGQDCSILLKHSRGKVTATLQSVKPISPSSSTSSSTSAKRKKTVNLMMKILMAIVATSVIVVIADMTQWQRGKLFCIVVVWRSTCSGWQLINFLASSAARRKHPCTQNLRGGVQSGPSPFSVDKVQTIVFNTLTTPLS